MTDFENDIEPLVLIEHYADELSRLAREIRQPSMPHCAPHTDDLAAPVESLRAHVAALNKGHAA